MKQSITKQLHVLWEEVLSPKGVSFPRVIARFTELGVKRYHVDFVTGTVTSYIGHEADVAILPLEKFETEAAWNPDKIKEAIRQISSNSITYSEFQRGILDAGVTNYWGYIAGRRVAYMGEYGDAHVEWFPSQKD
jgi:uncharacterized protein YbcV (DUF1398 family)